MYLGGVLENQILGERVMYFFLPDLSPPLKYIFRGGWSAG